MYCSNSKLSVNGMMSVFDGCVLVQTNDNYDITIKIKVSNLINPSKYLKSIFLYPDCFYYRALVFFFGGKISTRKTS